MQYQQIKKHGTCTLLIKMQTLQQIQVQLKKKKSIAWWGIITELMVRRVAQNKYLERKGCEEKEERLWVWEQEEAGVEERGRELNLTVEVGVKRQVCAIVLFVGWRKLYASLFILSIRTAQRRGEERVERRVLGRNWLTVKLIWEFGISFTACWKAWNWATTDVHLGVPCTFWVPKLKLQFFFEK